MENVEQTIISQYANSATIIQLIQNMNTYIDPRANIQAFYNTVWNVETAIGFGLDIWGRIVGVGRVLQIPVVVNYFGFAEMGVPGALPFDEGVFFNGDVVTQNYTLLDDAYRVLILTKALANISATTSPALNRLLQNLFAGRGRCYVNDLGQMMMRYTFEFTLEPFELAIMQAGILPAGAGVEVFILQANLGGTFGFAEMGSPDAQPFGSGVFL